MTAINRRQALAATAAISFSAGLVRAAEATPQRVKLSIAGYSLRKYLDLKKPANPPMDYFQFAEFAAGMGLNAIEVTSYYIPDTANAWLSKFKRHCTRLGLDISGVAINNDFCTADAAKRKSDIAKVKQWLEITEYLGGKTLRVFAGNTPKGDTEEAARARCIDCCKSVSDMAPKYGVVVAIENHHGIVSRPDQILAIVDGVKHEWFGINLDTGNFNTSDPYADLAKCAAHAVVVQMKIEVKPAGKPKVESDFPRLFSILRDARYHGYVALEYEGAEDPKTGVPKYIKKLQQLVG